MLEDYDGFKMLYAKLTLKVSDITLEVRSTETGSGIGVYACQDIPEDTFIMTFAGSGPVLPNTNGFQNQNRFQISESHSITVTNLAARFINHSCNPNCGHLQGTELYSITGIAKGEQLAYDYSCSMTGDGESFECHCGYHWCRKRIGNFLDIEDDWRKRYYMAAGIVSPHCLLEPIEIGPTVADARRGDGIRVAGLGHRGKPLEFEVERILRYRRGGETRTEFGGRSDRGWAYLEWEESHPVFCLSLDDQNKTLRDIGLSQKDLLRLGPETPQVIIELDGRTFHYEGSEVVDCSPNRGKPRKLRMWEFDSDDGEKSLTIEQEGSESPEVSVGTWVRPLDVEVMLRKKKEKKRGA